MQNMSGRPHSRASFDMGYKQISAFDSAKGIGVPSINSLELPPLRPRTVFSNVKTTGKVYFPPGGFKTYKTNFSFDGTIYKLCRDITQINQPGNETGKYPPPRS